MLPFIELPYWTRWSFVIALFSAFSVITFFTYYDPLLNPADSFQYALVNAGWMLLPPISRTVFAFLFGRLFRIPVRWKFLWQLEMATLALSFPLFLGQFWLESSYSTYGLGPWVFVINCVVIFACSTVAFWQKYQPETKKVRVVSFLTLSAVICVLGINSSVSQMLPCLRASQPWTSFEQGRIRCFYTDANPNARVRANLMAKRIETMLGKVETKLQSPPVGGKINVFIFPDYDSLNIYQNTSYYKGDEQTEDDYGIVGVAGLNGILLYDSDWEEMRSTVSHEMAHLVLGREIGDMRSVVDEGTAVWVENELSEGELTTPIKQQPISTVSLAAEDVFYTDDAEKLFDCYYPHAGWLAQYSIEHYGLKKWKELARSTTLDYVAGLMESDDDAERHFQISYKRIYSFAVP